MCKSRNSISSCAAILSVVAGAFLAIPAHAAGPGIRVVAQGTFVHPNPISRISFSPSLKFEFAPDARTAKVRVEIEVNTGPSGKDGISFALPETTQKWVEVNSYQSDVALEIPDSCIAGTYKGRLKFTVDPPTMTIDPPEVPFAFTIVEANIKLEWEKGDPGSKLRLGSVSTGGAGSWEGPKFTIKMSDGVESGTKVNFEAEPPVLGVKAAGGQFMKGVGALGAGTYTLGLDPEARAKSYRGRLTFKLLSVGTKLNDSGSPIEYSYDVTVTSPLKTLLMLLLAVIVLGLVGAAGYFVMGQLKSGRKASGKAVIVDGLLEFLVPMERRPEQLERVGKARVVFGDKGDILKDVRKINFELAAYNRGGKKVVELTRLKGSCPVFVNGVDAFNVELYDGDMMKFGEYPTFEVRYRNPELERPVEQVYGEGAAPAEEAAEPAHAQPISISVSSSDEEGEIQTMSGESKKLSRTPAASEELPELGFAEFEEPPPSRSKAKSAPDDDIALNLDMDLDEAPPPKRGGKAEAPRKDSIDLPEGFDILGEDES
ncbi:MAG: hypothetical protein U0166_08950 [Acidobacteriota bacterium]